LKGVCVAFLAMALGIAAANSGNAADKRTTVLNQNAVGVVANNVFSGRDAVAIAHALDHTANLRVLPIIGRGSLQGLNDLLFLESADVAVVSSDSLAYARKHKLYADETGKIAYLAKLSNSSIILLAHADVNNINDLAGRKVAAGTADSDSFIAADLLFGDVGVDIERVAVNGADAIAALRDGRIDAALVSTNEAHDALAAVPKDSGLRIVPLMASERLATVYAPAIVSAEDYPGLIAGGQPVETVAAAMVLAVYDWPKSSQHFTKLKKFNTALFENYFASLSKDRVTNFSAAVPGWKPYGAVRESKRQPMTTAAPQFVAFSN
jgi:uncharacterized protein